jgi:hypothetical protein
MAPWHNVGHSKRARTASDALAPGTRIWPRQQLAVRPLCMQVLGLPEVTVLVGGPDALWHQVGLSV